MNDDLQVELAKPVSVTLGGLKYPLGFPMGSVIAYKQKTAELNMLRAKGRERLSPESIRKMRDEAGVKLFQATSLAKTDKEKAEELMAEANSIRQALDEDAGIGDSLFDLLTWSRIDPRKDPERFIYCLWAGLHQYDAGKDKLVPALSLDKLASVIDFSNVTEVAKAIRETLESYFPKSESGGAVPDPQLAESQVA